MINLMIFPEALHIFPEPGGFFYFSLFLKSSDAVFQLLFNPTHPRQYLILFQKYLRRRIDADLFYIFHGSLALHIDPPDIVHLISPELDPAGAILRQRKYINDPAPHRKFPLFAHLRYIFIANVHQTTTESFQLQHIPDLYLHAVVFVHGKWQTVVHPPVDGGHNSGRLLFHQPLDHLQPLLHDRLSMYIRTVKNEVLRRIIHSLGNLSSFSRTTPALIQFQIFH